MITATYPITVEATWTEADVIPPRCSKPRDINHEIEHVVNVPMIRADEFPIALITTSSLDGEKEYHYYNGRLYAPYLPYSRQKEMFTAGSEDFAAVQRMSGWNRYRTLDEMHAHIEAHYAPLLIVDGKVWTLTASEPFYAVVVARDSWSGPRYTYLSVDTRSNQAEYTHFNANEREEAIAYALSATPEAMREETLKRLESETSTIQVLIPEAVKRTFNRTRAKGEEVAYSYSSKLKSDFEKSMEHSAEFVDPEAVGRGEISYRDYLEAALKHLSEVEEPRQRALEAERGW